MKTLERNIRVPIELVMNTNLTSDEKMFYVKLLDSIVQNEIAIIPYKITFKERVTLKRLKQLNFIENYNEQPQVTTVKFDLKGFTSDGIKWWTKRVNSFK